MSESAPRYRFGPRSTRGLIAGWSTGQVVSVALGTVVGLGLLRSVGGGGGVLLAFVSVTAGLAVARWPVAGRPLEAWAPTVARFTAASLAEGRLPWRVGGRTRRGTLSHLEVREVEGRGVVIDKEAATWSAVLVAGGNGFALRDDEAQAGAISSWAELLASLTTESHELHRLQWIARTRPSGRADWLDRPAGSEPLAAAYDELLEARCPDLVERETLVVLSVRAPRAGIGQAARLGGADETARRLFSATASLGERLCSSGVEARGPLGAAELCLAVRRAYEDTDRPSVGAWPFPLGLEAGWSNLRTDASWQATYWVAEWPRSEVGPAVMIPLLLGGARRQSVSLTLAPLPAGTAVRRAERERTSGQADSELRRRHGFSLTARSRAEQEMALEREAELAAGHGAFCFSGYVTVTAGDEAELETACEATEQAAALCHLELRRLFGAQEEGWACTLPTGRGCR